MDFRDLGCGNNLRLVMFTIGIACLMGLFLVLIVYWLTHRARIPLVARDCRTCAMSTSQVCLGDIAEDCQTQNQTSTPPQCRMQQLRERMVREDVEEQPVQREAAEVFVVRVAGDEEQGMTASLNTDVVGSQKGVVEGSTVQLPQGTAGVSAQNLSGETWRVSSASARWDLYCDQCGGGEDCSC